MRKLVLSAVLLFLYVFMPARVYALDLAEQNAAVSAAVNGAVMDVFERLAEKKDFYPVLKDLDQGAVKLNDAGLKEIAYRYESRDGKVFEFYLRALPVNVTDERSRSPGYRELVFPLIGLKVVLYVQGRSSLGALNPVVLVEGACERLYEIQKDLLPLQLQILPLKDTFKEGEPVEFHLVLRNASRTAIKIKPLNERSLYCELGGATWGTKDPRGPNSVILDPGKDQKVRIKFFTGSKGNVPVFCSYGVGLQGIRPRDKKFINIK